MTFVDNDVPMTNPYAGSGYNYHDHGSATKVVIHVVFSFSLDLHWDTGTCNYGDGTYSGCAYKRSGYDAATAKKNFAYSFDQVTGRCCHCHCCHCHTHTVTVIYYHYCHSTVTLSLLLSCVNDSLPALPPGRAPHRYSPRTGHATAQGRSDLGRDLPGTALKR